MVWTAILPFRTVEERGGVTLFLNVTKLMAWQASLCVFLLTVDMLWVCGTHINCADGLPTVSYMASFRPNDRLATLAMCIFALGLPSFYLLMHSSVSSTANVWDLRVMTVIATTTSIAVPFTQVFDEVNLTHFGPSEKMHLVMVVGVVGLVCIWTYLYLLSLWRRPKSPLRGMERTAVYALCYTLATAGVALFAFFQWYFPKGDDWAAHFSEPISEYAAIAMALYLPCVLTLLSHRTEIEIATTPVEKAAAK